MILGGVRSGKSRYAEQCANDSGKQVIYGAAATVSDVEMRHRIDFIVTGDLIIGER